MPIRGHGNGPEMARQDVEAARARLERLCAREDAAWWDFFGSLKREPELRIVRQLMARWLAISDQRVVLQNWIDGFVADRKLGD